VILGIDPGTTESGWVYFDDQALRVAESGVSANDRILFEVATWQHKFGPIAIENIESSRGMPVGADTFRTVRWIGRFEQASMEPVILIDRRDVKMHICGKANAKDSNIRQALIDQLGPPGRKSEPGPTYGVTKHAWQALAVAVTAAETREGA
jgi:Holliday junction resolvasome RuvABC endonuclease subunit